MKKFFLMIAATMLVGVAAAQNAKIPENITIKTLDGKTVETSVIKNDGKPIILSFWATWCKPCNRELNTIKEVYEEWQEETGVKLVAISIDDSKSAARVKPHVDGNEWEYEVYLDQNQDFKRAMNVVNVPHTFIINGEGEIVWQHTSFVEGGEEELIELVRKVANGEEI
ncbi:MAG: TlpA family protein disulfide reductase [Bacteroidales bacterium]|nr:TlpA family protein disulfide reductase [Bacteroidales bacterium]MBP5516992.1 TlpA family protein disulfide reductase [Bacteroidales bacterium]